MENLKLLSKTSDKLPDSWILTRLKNISDLISGQHILKDDYNFYAQGLPYLTGPADFGSKSPIISKWTTKPKAISTKNDILITVKGAGVGKSNLLNIEEAAISRQLMAVRPFHVDPNYLFSFVQFNFHSLQKLGAGSTVPGIDRESILNIPLPLPPLPEQRRIVAKIEDLFTQLDAGVSALEKSRAQLKRYRQSVLKAAVEGRLTEEWRRSHPDVEPASVLLERIEREREKSGKGPRKKLPPLDTSGLPELPEGWEWATAEQLAANEANSITDGPFGSNLKTSHYTYSGPRVIRLQNIGRAEFVDEKAHISEGHFKKLKKHSVYPGDIVIAALGSPAPRACLIPSWVGDAIVKADCVRFKAAQDYVFGPYIMYSLNSYPTQKRTEDIIHGVGRPRLNLKQIRSITLPLPTSEEQKIIVSEIERCLSVADQTEVTLEGNLRRAARLRQSILKKAFKGELVAQDPNDEPASVLLERIKAERSQTRPINKRGQARRGRGRPRKNAAVQTELI